MVALGLLLGAVMAAVGCTGGGADVADQCEDQEETVEPLALPDTAGLDRRQQERLEVLWASSVPVLTTPGDVSCLPLVEAAPLVDANEFGAFTSVGLSHDSPDFRYDLIYFADRQPTVETGQLLVERVKAGVADDSAVEFFTVASALFVVVSHPDSDDVGRDEIIDAYNQKMAGTE